jgi:TolB-like protein/class 3 adenylate cyclase/tetratricopeptide (TPR) repeat protein
MESSIRRLAAIMFTDIKGYTALMQQNEEKAIQVRNKHRHIFNSITLKHKGRILQYYGDGTLSIFDSAIVAVKCGIEMQLGFQKDPAIPVRIGIHTGDILFSNEEIIGDGVNVASRIESLAVPGSVFISDKVYDEIKNHTSIKTSHLKQFQFKNVEKPIEVYAISNIGLVVPQLKDLEGKISQDHTVALEDQEHGKSKFQKRILRSVILIAVTIFVIMILLKLGTNTNSKMDNLEKSIAVLAFDNMSGDPAQEYFSDGISEEILNALTKVEGLKVAGRTSAFSFKGKNEDIRSIGEKLDVKMVLEGSVRKAGTQVRITAQLIDVKDGFHLWSETYHREMADIFVIQDDIAARIVDKLKLQIQERTEKGIRTKNLEAYDMLLKGVYFLNKDFEGTRKAMEYFQKAVELDPDYAAAYARIGDTYTNYASYGFMPSAEAYTKARAAAQKSIRIHEQEPIAHKIMAYVHLYYDWNWEAAISEYNKAIQYGLDDPDHFITFYDMFVEQNYEHAIQVAQQILDDDPLEMQHHWHLGLCYYLSGQFEEATISFNGALELDPNYSEGYRWKGAALSAMGKHDEAILSIERALEITHGEGPAFLDLLMAKINKGEKDKVFKILNQLIDSGEYGDPMLPAVLFTQLGHLDKACQWLEQSYRERSLFIITLKAHNLWDPLRESPCFIEIFKQMGFPE